MPHSGRFERADRVVSVRDYRRLRRRGKRKSSRNFAVSVAPLRLSVCELRYRDKLAGSGGRRLGMTVSRRVGNAVVRNRVKRSIREWFRHSRETLEQDIDLVVVAKPSASRLAPNEIFKELRALFDATPGVLS